MRELDRAVEEAAASASEVGAAADASGSGDGVGLAFVLTVGPVERFPNSRKLVSYWG